MRHQVEDLTTKLMAAEKRNDEIFHIFELTKDDNFELLYIVEVATGQAKRSNEEINLRIQELAEAHQARIEDKKKLEEAWSIIMHLSENNQRLSKDIEKGKAKKKKLREKHNACHLKTRNLLDIVDNEIQTHLNDITELKLEKHNLQWQIEDLLDPEEIDEGHEEEEKTLPIEAVGNGELSD